VTRVIAREARESEVQWHCTFSHLERLRGAGPASRCGFYGFLRKPILHNLLSNGTLQLQSEEFSGVGRSQLRRLLDGLISAAPDFKIAQVNRNRFPSGPRIVFRRNFINYPEVPVFPPPATEAVLPKTELPPFPPKGKGSLELSRIGSCASAVGRREGPTGSLIYSGRQARREDSGR